MGVFGHDLTDPALFANGFPHRVFTGIRRDCPVAWHEPSARSGVSDGFWSIAGHTDVCRVLARAEVLSRGRPSSVDDAVALGLVELARRPWLLDLARGDDRAALSAELARWVCPQIVVWCRALEELAFGRHLVAPGERLACWLPSANRDDTVFGRDAMDFVAERRPNPHLTFCLVPDGPQRFADALAVAVGASGSLVLTSEPEYLVVDDAISVHGCPVELQQ